MAQMSETRYRKLKEEIVSVKKKHEEAMEAMAVAREFGDLRENEEYSTARRNSEEYARRIAEIEEELNNAEIVTDDHSPRITIGTTVDVCRVDNDGKPLEEPRRFRVDAHGDTVIQGVLGINSSLGRAILNGTSGIYRVVDNGGVIYNVKKVLEE